MRCYAAGIVFASVCMLLAYLNFQWLASSEIHERNPEIGSVWNFSAISRRTNDEIENDGYIKQLNKYLEENEVAKKKVKEKIELSQIFGVIFGIGSLTAFAVGTFSVAAGISN